MWRLICPLTIDEAPMNATSPATPQGAPVIIWFRRDLRLADNPALAAAVASGRPVIPVFVLEQGPGIRKEGAASLWWLDKSLNALASDLARRGSRLILKKGPAERVIPELAAETGACLVTWNRLYDPGLVDRDTRLKKQLRESGIAAESFNASLLVEPWRVRNKAGEPFKVFTPFWRAAQPLLDLSVGVGAPSTLSAPVAWPRGDELKSWGLHPARPDWSVGFDIWTPGEAGAWARLEAFLENGLGLYADKRDFPAVPAVSRLSPHLHFGEIGPRQIFAALAATEAVSPEVGRSAEKFRAELGWREFSHSLLFQRPDLETNNFKSAFDAFPWRQDGRALDAWKRGLTGYPMVDAGMRELWTTGFMHNRVRMLTASFLAKHLLVDWREGEAWFWDTLVDADRASNSASWQWVAGSGADAAPYFRIFSPMGQGEKFDSDGAYVRKWAPELARLPNAVLHAPWQADPLVLKAAGVVLGATYPRPIVDHAFARARALAALDESKQMHDQTG